MPTGFWRAVRTLVGDAEPEQEHAFVRLAAVDRPGGVAECENVGADVDVPRTVVGRDGRQRYGQQPADVEEPERVVLAIELIVVVRAQAQFDGDRDGRFSAGQRPAWTDAKLEVGALVRAAVGTDRSQLLRQHDIGRDLVAECSLERELVDRAETALRTAV